ncbi:gamma-glutamyl-gamma-aminobutyrate hydrolase family protein [Streptomyces sp. NPDC059740]|uniref:gamma-glutamyl-gamma-aminobutyrate hydrolase family protein n=1 Tax=Streptomyces sp. NPDC059740 TaxID=3346926 RepID=UPI0036572B92
MPKPLVGITTYLEDEARWGVWTLPAALLPAGYPRMVREAGGVAVMLPPDEEAVAEEVVARLDALVVAGGPDVEPARYGAERLPRTGPPAPARDAWELALIRAALHRGVPLLGVCRGMQLLNVARGGTLLQHRDGHAGPPGVFAHHRVAPLTGTLTHRLLGGPVTVPTYHHQCVAVLGAGLQVSARAQDGTVEAVEAAGGDGFVLGVQWHPEAGDDTRVMAGLVAAARR